MKILAFTGAGISKQSNIPTFMERPDVREKLFRTFAEHHHEAYNEVIRELKANMNGAEPNLSLIHILSNASETRSTISCTVDGAKTRIWKSPWPRAFVACQ